MKRLTPLPSALGNASADYLDALYAQYRQDPASVEAGWQPVFRFLDDVLPNDVVSRAPGQDGASAESADRLWDYLLRRHGHLLADLNPLGGPQAGQREALRAFWQAQGAPAADPSASRPGPVEGLAVETAHVSDLQRVQWVDASLCKPQAPLAGEALMDVWRVVVQAAEFERFLMTRFPGKKKFGIEGSEAALIVLDQVLTQAAQNGVEEVVLGSMHRGRLNLMANILGKPLEALLSEFMGHHPFPQAAQLPADVPYHLGHEGVVMKAGIPLKVRLLPNPSHLEAVDPVALGAARGLQGQAEGAPTKKVMAVILHTDAAVIGQGLVAECLQLAGLDGYGTGGTVHVVINNQLGFTTEPQHGRSSRYCTDVWKATDSLILHVHGDRPEAAVQAARLAVDYRLAQGQDAVIDVVGYRRHGHNEFDEPRFTQPVLYRQIDAHESLAQQLERRLVADGALTPEAAKAFAQQAWARLDAAFHAVQARGEGLAGEQVPAHAEVVAGVAMPEADARAPAADSDGAVASGVPVAQLQALLEALSYVPETLAINDRLARQVKARQDTDKGVPWAVGEALAFGSLLAEGRRVRLSGQDVVRGAFSHRHYVLTDTQGGPPYCALNHLAPDQGVFEALNSPLSEYGVLGFEYGYSLTDRHALVVWEAQFGDFANGAQIMIDQFVTSGYDKWLQRSGLVMLLPHGLEGQGPEHSSARIERYLQLCANHNLWVIHPSTPANYFHALRTHVLTGQPRPLIVMAPKTLLRLPAAVSPLAAFGPSGRFEPLIVGQAEGPVTRVVLCTGKIAYELEAQCRASGRTQVRIARLEQLYPVPAPELLALLRAHPEAEWVWAQDEPDNMGAWPYYDRRLEDLAREAGCRQTRFHYCGRPESTSPAGSFHTSHDRDQAAILTQALA